MGIYMKNYCQNIFYQGNQKPISKRTIWNSIKFKIGPTRSRYQHSQTLKMSLIKLIAVHNTLIKWDLNT